MNTDVLLLFFNAVFSVVLAAAIVYGILRKEYKPTIKELENKAEQE